MVGVWWNVIDVIVCLLVLTRLCCIIGHCLWTSSGRSKRLGEWEEQDGVVVGVFCPLPYSGPLSILNAHKAIEPAPTHG